MFTNCSLKSFSDLRVEFQIPRRHLITTLEKAGWVSLEWSRIEEILINSQILKGRISEIYSALLDYHNSSLVSLKNVWQKDLGCNFSEELWGTICQNIFTSFFVTKFMHRMYLTPLWLSKMYPNVSSRHHRCKTYIGSVMHIFWECRKLKDFWKAVQDFTTKVLQIPLDNMPTQYLFGTELDRTLYCISVKRLGILSYLAKKNAFSSAGINQGLRHLNRLNNFWMKHYD